MNKSALIMMAAVLLSACAHTGEPDPREPPDWVSGDSRDYPLTQYLVGRGEADSTARARDRARADLARIFEVTINEATRDIQTFHSSHEGVDSASNIHRELQTRTERVISGVEIADQWLDPDNDQHHALAILPRSRASRGLREQISELDRGTSGLIEKAQSSEDPLRQAGAANRALGLQQQRQALNRSLQAIDDEGRGIPARWSVTELATSHRELLQRIHIHPRTQGQDSDRLLQMLEGALAEAGFSVSEQGPYRMHAQLDYERMGPRNGWYWYRGSLRTTLEDANGTTRDSQQWDLRVSASEAELARARLHEEVEQLLRAQVASALRGPGQE